MTMGYEIRQTYVKNMYYTFKEVRYTWHNVCWRRSGSIRLGKPDGKGGPRHILSMNHYVVGKSLQNSLAIFR